ncbi:alpha/beta hydrolase [Alteromonas halophila]|uniref:Alpha/beta hydrolase n=1 Tax=Alteromonas halophila TaxID=516698 RepID=A0A918MY91_9ALTE|nr:alpha/beta hydrolase [Alteromonas halophila]GGW84103.1 alpha/beta hydrolase [Alteromonas halophila]
MSNTRFFMFAFLIAIFASGCAIDVSPRSFVQQASEKTPMDTTGLHAAAEKDEVTIGITSVELTNAQGLVLKGLAVTYPDPIANIVFFGGNGMTISKSNAYLHRLGMLPANILWIDYQGMGASERAEKVTLDNFKKDALQVFDYASDVFPTNLPTLVHGLSMGSLLAPYVATKRDVDGMVLEGAINGVPELVDNMVPFWSKPFTKIDLSPEMARVDNSVFIEQYTGPLLMIVGEKDKTTPLSFTQRLFQVSPSDKKFLFIVPKATHASTMKNNETIEQYREFLKLL